MQASAVIRHMESNLMISGSDRSVLHLDLDTFFVSVERLNNSRLNGKPVVIGGFSDRSVVSSCSYEARSYGVRSAMPVRMAMLLCPEAIMIRGDMELYTKYSRMVTDIIAEKAPVYEKTSVDEHYVDLTGMDRFHGCKKWSHELRDCIIRETGLPISMGLSVNKTVSKIATGEAKPNGEKEVVKEMVLPFLDPLSIRKIPMIGEKTYHLLRSMGISTIYTLRNIPSEMIGSLMGKNGIEIWKRSNGIDNTPVISYSEKKSVSNEHTFEKDTTDTTMLNRIIAGMVEKLAYELRRKEKLTSCVTVKVRYSNFDTHTLQKRIAYTSFDHELITVAKELFGRLYQRRMLIRLIGIRLSHLVNGVRQLDMFTDTPEMVRLYMAVDRMRERFGKNAVRKAVGIMTEDERHERDMKVISDNLKETQIIEDRIKKYAMYYGR